MRFAFPPYGLYGLFGSYFPILLLKELLFIQW